MEVYKDLSSKTAKEFENLLNSQMSKVKIEEGKIINGTVIMLNKLITAVRDIDKATSPSANLVITFEVTPPGAAAIIITPIAISGGVLKIIINK